MGIYNPYLSIAKRLLDWEPAMSFVEGLHRTMDWYFETKDRGEVRATLEGKLTER